MEASESRTRSTSASLSQTVAESPAFADPRLSAIEHQVVQHGRVASLEEAAALRGVPASAVIKTMVVRREDGDYVFVLVLGMVALSAWSLFQ